jgi:hypothetical protein
VVIMGVAEPSSAASEGANNGNLRLFLDCRLCLLRHHISATMSTVEWQQPTVLQQDCALRRCFCCEGTVARAIEQVPGKGRRVIGKRVIIAMLIEKSCAPVAT